MNADLLRMSLSLAALGSGAGAIYAGSQEGQRTAFYLLKPLTTSLVFVMVVAIPPGLASEYGALIAVGLLFSVAGDILLMLPARYFTFGILSFAVTHVLYILAFTLHPGMALFHPLTVVLGLFAIVVFRLIWPGLKRSFRVPVLIYMVLIATMAAQSTGGAILETTARAAVAAAGALLFLLSDAVLAYDRFRAPFSAARTVVLFSYWSGQWLIALSASLSGAV